MNVENNPAAALTSAQTLEETANVVDALVMSATKFCEMHALYERKYHRRLAAGLLPERVKIGGRYFFRTEDAIAWRDPLAERKRPATNTHTNEESKYNV